MIRIYLLGLSLISIILFIGCGSSNPTLATISDEKITLHDYEDNYAKNNGGWDSSRTSSLENRQKFLDLIVKYKLKVKEAYSQGLERDSAIISEIDNYRVTAAQSYIIENELVKPGVERMYERQKEDVRVSHIFFRIPPGAKPADTLAAYERAMKVLAMIPQVPFDTLAFKFSEDSTSKSKYGDLGFEASGRSVPEFEDTFYLLKPGECSKTLIRSHHGYHIIKVTARRPNIGSIRLSSIYIKFNESLHDTAAARDTIWMLYHRLKSGASFSELAQKYSQNAKSAANKGDIGFYQIDRMSPNLVNVFYSLQIDSITEPMKFKFGYQIFKETERKELPQLSEIQKDLKDQYQRVRYPYEYKQYMQKLKTQYQVVIDSAIANKLICSLDTSKAVAKKNWKDTLSLEMLKSPLIFCTGRSFTIGNFVDRLFNLDDKQEVLTPSYMGVHISKFAEDMTLEEHARSSIKRYPELVQLFRDYEEGTLLYRIEQDEVWKKVLVNDSLLREYYNINKENYRWPERVNFAEIYTLADSAAKEAYWQVLYGEDFLEVAYNHTNRAGYKEKKGEWGFQPITLNGLSNKASTMAIDSVTPPFRYESGWSIIKMLGRDNPHVKSFEEAMPEVASEYQDVASKQREQEWVKALEKKYPVNINKEVLLEAFKRKRVESQ